MHLRLGTQYFVVAALLWSLFIHPSAAESQPIDGGQSSKARFEEYIKTYWYRYDFGDTQAVSGEEFERPFARYLQALSHADSGVVVTSFRALLDSAQSSSVSRDRVVDLTEKYLYNTASAQCNDELYLALLEVIISHSSMSEVAKIRPRYQQSALLKSRVGEVAADVDIVQSDGSIKSLHSIQAQYTLLIFFDAQCGECARVEEVISSVIHLLDDKDVEVIKLQPTEQMESLYHIRAIPAIYLLDSEKRVVLKECSIDEVLDIFSIFTQKR